jgi:biopolymer transport protein ExbD/biopolymer transport protein TolR
VKEITQDRLVLTIDASKRVYLGDQPININEIPATLKRKQRGRDQVIYIRADESIPFGVFATVMDSVKQGGITNVSIVTQPYSQTGKAGGL